MQRIAARYSDIGNWAPTKLNPHRIGDPSGRLAGLDSHAERARHYIETISALVAQPWFLGFHWCAYVENKARGWGIKDPWDNAYEEFTVPDAKGFLVLMNAWRKLAPEPFPLQASHSCAYACD